MSESDRPVSQPHVVLVRWPIDLKDPFDGSRISTAAGDQDGKFQATGLRPGEYLVFAVAGSDRGRLDQPHVLENLLGQAQKLTLSQGGFQNIRLDLLATR